jgi:ribosomal 50S subunit-recycling heat shock protein
MDEVRIDKWLWAARFFKPGRWQPSAGWWQVEVNGESAKRSRPSDRATASVSGSAPEHLLTVRALSGGEVLRRSRRPATRRIPKVARRQRLAEQHRMAAPVFDFGEGKPSKKQRKT